MGRRTTTGSKVAAGNPGKKRLPVPVRPEKAAKFPKAPDWLKGRRPLQIWKTRGPTLWRLGLLTELDLDDVARWCVLQAQFEELAADVAKHGVSEETEKGGSKQRPEAAVMLATVTRLEAVERRFGMSPLARQGLEAPADDDPAAAQDAHDLWRAKAARVRAKKG